MVRDARYLDLIAADQLVDRRNREAHLFHNDVAAELADINIMSGGIIGIEKPELILPRLELQPPVIPQRYYIVIACEKSTSERRLATARRAICHRHHDGDRRILADPL